LVAFKYFYFIDKAVKKFRIKYVFGPPSK